MILCKSIICEMFTSLYNNTLLITNYFSVYLLFLLLQSFLNSLKVYSTLSDLIRRLLTYYNTCFQDNNFSKHGVYLHTIWNLIEKLKDLFNIDCDAGAWVLCSVDGVLPHSINYGCWTNQYFSCSWSCSRKSSLFYFNLVWNFFYS